MWREGTTKGNKGPTSINSTFKLHIVSFAHYFLKIEFSLGGCSTQEKQRFLAQEFQAKLLLISKNFECLPSEALGEFILGHPLEFIT